MLTAKAKTSEPVKLALLPIAHQKIILALIAQKPSDQQKVRAASSRQEAA